MKIPLRAEVSPRYFQQDMMSVWLLHIISTRTQKTLVLKTYYGSFQYAVFLISLQPSKTSLWVQRIILLQIFTPVAFLILARISQMHKKKKKNTTMGECFWSCSVVVTANTLLQPPPLSTGGSAEDAAPHTSHFGGPCYFMRWGQLFSSAQPSTVKYIR